MDHRHELRAEYLRRVCAALSEYIEDGLPLRIHSRQLDGSLEVTFKLSQPDAFHRMVEGRPATEAF